MFGYYVHGYGWVELVFNIFSLVVYHTGIFYLLNFADLFTIIFWFPCQLNG